MMRNYSRMGFLNRNIVLSILIILICNNSALGDRWSRQLSPNAQSAGNDWVPISNEKVHDKSGRSLQFGEDLVPAEQQQYQFFAEPSNNRYNLQQTHPQVSASASEINQFAAQPDSRTTFQTVPPVPQFHHSVPPVPSFQFVNQQQSQPKLRTVQSFGGPVQKPFAEPLIQQQRSAYKFVQNQVRGPPQVQQYQSPPGSHVQHFGNSHVIPHFQQLPQQQQRVPQFQTHQQPPQHQHQQSQPQQPQFQGLLPQPNQGQSEEEVQLLYVPYDTLYQQKQQQQSQNQQQFQSNRFNALSQPVSASLINDFYSTNDIQQFPLQTIITTTRRPSTNRQTAGQTTQRPTTPYTSYYQTIPTELPATSKPKAHQPPLSMFMLNDKFTGKVTESDVLSTLRKSNSIDVRDTVSKNSPKVFIGPSGMPPPEGYSKFELPYLSAIENNRFERKIEQLPFFVAPLSYRTPPGFSKIPLPAPHVGSVVVNQPQNAIESNESEVITADNYYTKPPIGATVRINPTNFDVQKPDTQKITLTSGFNYRPDSNVKLISQDYIFSSLPPHVQAPTSPHYQSRAVFTTPKPDYFPTSSPSLLRTPLTKVKYSAIEEQRNNEFQTTLLPTTTRAPVTRQRFSDFEQPKTDFYSTIRSSTPRTPSVKSTYEELDEHKTVNEEYFNVELNNKPKYKISFSGSTNTPTKDFNFKPIPEFNFDSFSQTPDYITTKKPRTKVRNEQTKYQDEEQYKGHSQIQSFPSSTPLPTPSFDYTPTVSAIQNTDNYRQTNGGSTNGGNYFTELRSSPRPHSTVSTTTRFASEEIEHRPENDDFAHHRFNFANNVEKNAYNPSQDTSYTPQQYLTETTGRTNTPEYEDASSTTTENPNYSLPSELPAINAHLPGLVNSLMEEKWMTKNLIPEVDASSTTTARPNTRGRRPVSSSSSSSSTYRAASTTESSSDNFTRRPVNRGRRPSTYNTREATSTTESSRTRTPVARGSSRVKYNPSPEERQQFKSRGRTPSTSKQVKKEDQAIEYQRDVLNQNYPSSIQPIQPTEKPIEEYNLQNNDNEQVIQEEVQSVFNESNESVNDYNVTPQADNIDVIPLGGNVKILDDEQTNNYTPSQESLQYENNEDTLATTQVPQANNHKYSQNFLGLQEPMQVPLPQKTLFKHKGNHRNIESFYNTNSQNSQSSKPNYDDEITATQASPTTRLTTTTPEPTTTDAPVTKRTNFPRRRLTYTTTEGPKTTSEATDSSDSYTSRTKTRVDSRKEGAVVVKKVRGRVRQSTTTSTTETPNENETTKRTSTVTRSRTITSSRNNNRENTKERTNNNNENAEESKPRFRIRENTQRFRLEPQESQWSTRFSQNSFQPVDEEKSKSVKSLSVDDEQEIVTASADSDPMETYLFNVSASVVPTKAATVENDDDTFDETINMISTTEKEIDLRRRHKDSDFDSSFEKLVKDVMTEVDEEIEGKKELKSEKKPVINDKKGNHRRGVWKRVKVRPTDSFEAAESQNIGKHYYNSISAEEMKDSTRKAYDYETKMIEQEQVNVVTESSAEMEDSEEVIGEEAAVPTVKSDEPILEHIFSEIAETTTNMPGENIESETPKSEIFEVAKKALHDLFNFEDSDDDAIDMEEMDDKLENEFSTSTQSTIEDQSTTVTTTEVPEIKSTEQAKPMGSLVNPQMKTSTSTKVTHETEICYRGRCIKTEES